MNKAKKLEAINRVSIVNSTHALAIANLKIRKQTLKTELADIKIKKRDRLSKLQTEINKTKLPFQKRSKRAAKEREAKTFTSQIDSKNRAIQRIDDDIADKQHDIALNRLIIAQIKNSEN